MKKRTLAGIILLLLMLAALLIPWQSQAAATVGWTGQYYRSQNLSGPSRTQIDPVITFDWGDAPPLPIFGWPADHFSIRWTRTDTFLTGTYIFAARSDDGVRMYVDGVLIINEWVHRQFHWTSVEREMTAGQHRIVVEFYEDIGRAAIQAGYYPDFELPTPTPTGTITGTPGTSTPGGSTGGGGGGSSSSGPTPTRAPTQPSIVGTPGRTPTPVGAPPPLEAGIVSEETDPKGFTWDGFPGPALSAGGHDGQHSYVKNQRSKATFSAQWNFTTPGGGFYDVYVYIPASGSATASAAYRVFHAGQLSDPVVVNQAASADQWVPLGRYYFAPDELQYVLIDNVTGEATATRDVVLDAVLFIPTQ